MIDIVSKRLLVSLVKETADTKTKTQSLAEAIGERIKDAVENNHLNRDVFTQVARLYRQNEQKRNAFLRDFPLYVDLMREAGLFGAEHVGDLITDYEEVSPLPGGVKPGDYLSIAE